MKIYAVKRSVKTREKNGPQKTLCLDNFLTNVDKFGKLQILV